MELNARQIAIRDVEVRQALGDLLQRLNLLRRQLRMLDLPMNEKNKLNRMREEELYFWWQNARVELYEKYLAGQFAPAKVHQEELHKLNSPELVYHNFQGFKEAKVTTIKVHGKQKIVNKADGSTKWSVFFSSKALAPCLNNPSLQSEIMEHIVTYSLGYLQNSPTFVKVDEGPCTGMAFFIQELSEEFHMILCTELNKFINLIEGVPSCYEYSQILKVLGIVKSRHEARRVISAYRGNLAEDSVRFIFTKDVLIDGATCARNGVYMLPVVNYKKFLSHEEAADLTFSTERNRWVSSTAEKDQQPNLFSEDHHTSVVKRTNALILGNLLDHESCRGLIEFLTDKQILKYKLSPQEMELIGKPGNLIAIGRSGTGKTTCAVLRLFALQYLFHKNSKKQGAGFLTSVHGEVGDEASRLSLQCVFLTVSPVLIKEVSHFYEQIRAKVRNPDPGHVEESVLVEEKQLQWAEDNEGVIEYLNTHKFPYLLSIDKFLMIVDSQLADPFFVHELNERATSALSYHDQRKYLYVYNSARKPIKAFEIDFDYFSRHFWPKYQRRTRLSSATVWTEITSVLRGAAKVFKTIGRKHSILTSEEQEFVKQIYSEYNSWKLRMSGYDQQDRINHIIDSIATNGYHGFSIHYTIVDEVQDCPLNLLLLLIRLTEFNIAFSGDTAQTIAKGIGFKFGYLRSLISQYSERHAVPELSHLTVNFRSHSRILDVANNLVSLLKTFFPGTIDKLNDETSNKDGPKPIVIDSNDFTAIGLLLLGNANSVNRSRVDFGCNQVILVRSDEDKRNLPTALKHAVCLTVLESKGLEFEDVVVYNFFAKSECSAKDWGNLTRTVTDEYGTVKPDGFDPYKYPSLCSELKHLYVAVTRAKRRLIFFDEDSESRRCIQSIWTEAGLVEIASVVVTESGVELEGCEATDHITASTPEQWKAQGFKLLKLKYYEQALKCFQFSQDDEMIAHATAYYKADLASTSLSDIEAVKEEAKIRGTKLTKPQKRELAHTRSCAFEQFVEAAELFYGLGVFERAGQCFVSAEVYDRAIDAFEQNGSWKQAAEVYFRLRNYGRAHDLYMQTNTYDMAIECLVRLRCIDAAILLYKEKKDELQSMNGPEILTTLVYRKIRSLLSDKQQPDIDDNESQWTILDSDEFTVLDSQSESFSVLDASSEFSFISKTESVVELIEESNNDPLCAAITRLVGEFREELETVLKEREAIYACGRLYELIQNYDAVFDDRTDPEVIGLTLDLARLFKQQKLSRLIKDRYCIDI